MPGGRCVLASLLLVAVCAGLPNLAATVGVGVAGVGIRTSGPAPGAALGITSGRGSAEVPAGAWLPCFPVPVLP